MIDLNAVPEFDFHAVEYRSLFERSGATAFQHPDWLTSFYRYMAPSQDVAPLVICGRDGTDRRLALVVPLVKRRVDDAIVVEYASCGVTDYACPILAPELLASKPMGLAEAVADAMSPYDCLNIEPVRQDHLHAWRGLLDIRPQPLTFGTHAVMFGSSFEEWQLATLTSRRRSTLNRKVRRFTDVAPISLEVLAGTDIDDAFRKLRDFRKGRFTGDHLQESYGYQFYCDVASQGTASGLARTYRLSHGGATMAILFGIVDRKRFCYLLLGCDYEQYGKYSPGQIMFDQVMRHWAGEGGQVFDFTIGDEPFKRLVGCHRTPLSSLNWRRKSSVTVETYIERAPA